MTRKSAEELQGKPAGNAAPSEIRNFAKGIASRMYSELKSMSRKLL